MSSYKIYNNIPLYFTTSPIVEWYPVFTNHTYFKIITDSLIYCREEKKLRIHSYVIMLNHIHLIVSVENNEPKELSNIFRDFKQFTSREVTKKLKEENKRRVL